MSAQIPRCLPPQSSLFTADTAVSPGPFILPPLTNPQPWGRRLPSPLPMLGLMADFGSRGPLAGYLAMGATPPTILPVIAAAAWCVLFVAVAICRFRREES